MDEQLQRSYVLAPVKAQVPTVWLVSNENTKAQAHAAQTLPLFPDSSGT